MPMQSSLSMSKFSPFSCRATAPIIFRSSIDVAGTFKECMRLCRRRRTAITSSLRLEALRLRDVRRSSKSATLDALRSSSTFSNWDSTGSPSAVQSSTSSCTMHDQGT
eukprot:scaffold301_cov243-Pinguiococcus_pyrenoidosus.AAC.13